MRAAHRIAVIIPTLNEEEAIGHVLAAIPSWVDEVVVADNGSTDGTAQRAVELGARVVLEPRRGYGAACLAAIATLDDPDIVVFLDGDFSDYPEEAELLVDPIVRGDAELVVGSRTLGSREQGSLTPPQRFGNWLACRLLQLFWGATFTDLGPFRAIRYRTLQRLRMCDRNYGWTVEMQIKASCMGIPVREVPVSYRRRIGVSKVSGTVKGVLRAGVKIIGTIFSAAGGIMPTPRPQGPAERAIIFTRYPNPGEVKSRLIPMLGDEGAAFLHRALTERVVGEARELRQHSAPSVEILYSGDVPARFAHWLGDDLLYRSQGEGDLGLRMLNGFRGAFAQGMERVVLFGTDLPGLSGRIMGRALDELHGHDLVLGPANDGGYYLIGLTRPHGDLFADIPWGTAEVFKATLERARDLGLSVALADALDDLDRPEDLARRADHLPSRILATKGPHRHTGSELISVIIPTLNEAATVRSGIEQARKAEEVEIIVVDGGSEDRTAETARAAGARVITSDPGRASQMNRGAHAASGEILLFLHADTTLPQGWADHVRSVAGRSGVSCGAFALELDSEHRGLRIIERLANLRSKWLQLPYGDQALFMPRDVFFRIGGFPPLPVMEDFAMVQRLRRQGRVAIVPVPAKTSARRWREEGFWRTTLVNQLMIVGYAFGVSPAKLARWRTPASPGCGEFTFKQVYRGDTKDAGAQRDAKRVRNGVVIR